MTEQEHPLDIPTRRTRRRSAASAPTPPPDGAEPEPSSRRRPDVDAGLGVDAAFAVAARVAVAGRAAAGAAGVRPRLPRVPRTSTTTDAGGRLDDDAAVSDAVGGPVEAAERGRHGRCPRSCPTAPSRGGSRIPRRPSGRWSASPRSATPARRRPPRPRRRRKRSTRGAPSAGWSRRLRPQAGCARAAPSSRRWPRPAGRRRPTARASAAARPAGPPGRRPRVIRPARSRSTPRCWSGAGAGSATAGRSAAT